MDVSSTDSVSKWAVDMSNWSQSAYDFRSDGLPITNFNVLILASFKYWIVSFFKLQVIRNG